jgi:hypothetical protein
MHSDYILVLFNDCSETEIGVTEFMSQLNSSHVQGIDDLHYTFGDEGEEIDEEVVEEDDEQEGILGPLSCQGLGPKKGRFVVLMVVYRNLR